MLRPRALVQRSALGACVVVAACKGSLFGIGPRDEAALIIFYGDTSQITAPDTVTRGVSFNVTFRTFAGGCTRENGHDDLATTSSEVSIRPFDRNNGGQFCTDDLLRIPHAVPVQLATPGNYTIRVIAEQRGGSTGNVNGPAELTRLVTVR